MKPVFGRSTFFAAAGVATLIAVGFALAQPNPGGSGPGSGGPGGQGSPAPSSTITLNMCNKANDIPVIFAAGVGLVGQQFRAQGWVQVPAGQCAQVGTFARPTFWWHARDPKGLVWGKDFDVDVCVNLNGGFDYTWSGIGRRCTETEIPAPFMKLTLPPNVSNYTLTLN